MTTIQEGKVVSIEYVLRDTAGKELDRSSEGQPLVYLHGAQNIVPGLEAALMGKSVGDQLEVNVPPEQGYGPDRKVKVQKVLRSKFPDGSSVEKGASFMVVGPDGKPMPIWVKKVMGRQVHVTPQHPLAGVTLCFDVKVTDLRDATEAEVVAGRPQGPEVESTDGGEEE